MDVIGGAIDDERRATQFADNAPEVGKEIVADFGSDEGPASLGAEDYVDDEIGRGVRQVFFRPFGAGPFFSAFTHGLRRGLHSCAASRLIDCQRWEDVVAVMMVTANLVGYFARSLVVSGDCIHHFELSSAQSKGGKQGCWHRSSQRGGLFSGFATAESFFPPRARQCASSPRPAGFFSTLPF